MYTNSTAVGDKCSKIGQRVLHSNVTVNAGDLADHAGVSEIVNFIEEESEFQPKVGLFPTTIV